MATARVPHAALLALLLALGCKTDISSAAPVDQPEDPESPPKRIPMAEHFVQAEEIRDAVIAGRLDEVRAPASWLLENITAEDMPVRWRAHVPKVRRSAKRILEAEELAEAGAGAAELAAACGDCHEDIGVRMKAPQRPSPLQDDTTFAQMNRHAYAAQRMWDGLVGPLDDAWSEGATMMRDSPLHGDAAPEPILAIAADTHALATSAVDMAGRQRAEVYGEIVVRCAACHVVVDGP